MEKLQGLVILGKTDTCIFGNARHLFSIWTESLIDSEDFYKVIEKELFDNVGVRIDKKEHSSYQGCSNPVMWSLIKARHNVAYSLEELVDMTEERVISYFNDLPGIQPMTGVVELLDFLKLKGIKLALASSSSIDVIRIVLSKSGLQPFFDVIVDSLEARAGKPDPAIFLLAQKKLDIPKKKLCYRRGFCQRD